MPGSGVLMLHNLERAMAYHGLSSTDIPGLLWCASSHPNHSFGGVAHLALLFAVPSAITLVEYAMPGTSLLTGKPIHLVPWIVSLNVIVTLMICFRLLRMRALMREVLSPDAQHVYKHHSDAHRVWCAHFHP